MESVNRGHVYRFCDGKYTDRDRYALVVSSEFRSIDKKVSILMLSDHTIGHDVVRVRTNNDSLRLWAHCGMVTYTFRDYLVEDVAEVLPETMSKIDYLVSRELGLNDWSEK